MSSGESITSGFTRLSSKPSYLASSAFALPTRPTISVRSSEGGIERGWYGVIGYGVPDIYK